jgi:hypothetical protein
MAKSAKRSLNAVSALFGFPEDATKALFGPTGPQKRLFY